MPKKEWTPEEREAHSEKLKAIAAERKAKWARPARPELDAGGQYCGAAAGADHANHCDRPGPGYVDEHPERAEPEPPPAEAFSLAEWEQPEPSGPPEPERPLTEFEVFVASLPDDTAELLGEAELQRMFAEEQQAALDEKRKLARQKARDRARSHAKTTAGLLPPEKAEALAVAEKMSRKVRIRPQLPFVGDSGGLAALGVTIDGVTYHHGVEYTVPLSRALDIRHALYCMQQNDLDFEGKGRLHGLRQSHASSVNLVRI